MSMPPRLIIFAGPNGAGKSSNAGAILEALGVATFVNADLIARGLVGYQTGTAAFAAGRIMLGQLHDLAARSEDFAFESTLSSRSLVGLLRECKSRGYRVSIYYFALDSDELAVKRVARRVLMGGHSVPEVDIRRRFGRSAHNFFELYAPLADLYCVFDSSLDQDASIIALYADAALTLYDNGQWTHFQKISQRR